MPVTVHIPTPLRPYAGAREKADRDEDHEQGDRTSDPSVAHHPFLPFGRTAAGAEGA